MLARWSAVLGIFCFSVCAQAQTRTLAVYPGEIRTLDSVAAHSLQVELQRVLTPAGINVAMQPAGRSSGNDEFQLLVVGAFQGDCSVDTLARVRPVALRSGPLADASVSQGQVLPYFRVDCDRLVRTLTPALQRLDVPMREALLGRAIARVMAHEIYHIVAQTTAHAESGIGKTVLSIADLTANTFDLNPDSLRRMQPALCPNPSVSPAIPAAAFVTATRR